MVLQDLSTAVLCSGGGTFKVWARPGFRNTCPHLGAWPSISKSPPSSFPAHFKAATQFAQWWAATSATGNPISASSSAPFSTSCRVSYGNRKRKLWRITSQETSGDRKCDSLFFLRWKVWRQDLFGCGSCFLFFRNRLIKSCGMTLVVWHHHLFVFVFF